MIQMIEYKGGSYLINLNVIKRSALSFSPLLPFPLLLPSSLPLPSSISLPSSLPPSLLTVLNPSPSLPPCLPASLPASLPSSLPASPLPPCLPAYLSPCLPASLTPCLSPSVRPSVTISLSLSLFPSLSPPSLPTSYLPPAFPFPSLRRHILNTWCTREYILNTCTIILCTRGALDIFVRYDDDQPSIWQRCCHTQTSVRLLWQEYLDLEANVHGNGNLKHNVCINISHWNMNSWRHSLRSCINRDFTFHDRTVKRITDKQNVVI